MTCVLLSLSGAFGQEAAGDAEGERHAHDHSDEHDHSNDHEHDHDEASGEEHDHVAGSRLLVTDADSSTVSVFDLASGEVLASFSTPGAAGAAYSSPSGQYALIVHRNESRVSVVYSGLRLEDHGDHADLVQGAPYVLNTLNVGRQPTHFWAHGDEIALFNDADGTIAVLDERTFGLSLDYTSIQTAQPDHGAAVVLGDVVLSGYYELGRVDVYNRAGALQTSFEGCPGLHGEATLDGVAAFGCTDGVLLVKGDGDEMTSVKLDNPAGTAEGVRVGTLVSHDESAVMFGNFGAGLTLIDVNAETLEVVELPSAPLRFAFDHGGEHLLALTADGTLHLLEIDTGEVQSSVSVMAPVDTSGGFGSYVAPGLAIAEGAAYISVPTEGEIAEVQLGSVAELEVTRRIDVSGTPSSLALLALEGGVTH